MLAVYTDPDSPEIDAAQYREGKGPCLDAWRACADHGVASTLSLPMIAGESSIGAMNLYSRVHDGFGPDDEDVGMDLAAAAASVLANVSAYWTAFELSQQLNQAMATRSVIEQAKGILMARSPELTADGAFAMLRDASSART